MSANDWISTAKGNGVDAVHLMLADTEGGIRERRMTIAALHSLDGRAPSFCNVLPHWDIGDSVFNEVPFVGEPLEIDADSVRPYPFEAGAALVFADYAGDSAALSPRALLRRQIERAAHLGHTVLAAFEFEWLVQAADGVQQRARDWSAAPAWAVENRCWDGVTAAAEAVTVAGLDELLRSAGIRPYAIGMELGPGCLEATLSATAPLRAADEALLFKTFTKAWFRQRGQSACFMAQADAGAPGLSGHIHLSLHDAHGANRFHDAGSANGLSTTLGHFIAGVLQLLPELAALPLHTVNAWRRLSPPNWAPRTPSWGIENYSTAIRAVSAGDGGSRLEFRLPGADVNPYLGLAMLLAAGLYGIEHRLTPPAPIAGDARNTVPAGLRPLPRDLHEAAVALDASLVARELFGNAFVSHFAASRLREAALLRRCVSAQERARYFDAV
ncbi:glutamine synthetase family protein [Plasticicumulans acidivorans]|uniref:L-glutamine synthetase n=1 Tax=Plasticicumulans acidivorans TaxID=886464 RepID=A0A317MQE3_9GAMM|nr:glutamine synthetase family protein [Plasticicumulans acidivorans]PWV58854.1 L-glutamine synthetase [Plasticicumulans acidivorans]